ncbi:MAG: nicotinate (nicotinamide) nucleotide adenylyltransferase [Desulfobulbus propionicus]|nr:MAG: nicotinate (nicotinamide) nucleotide adenylyltransferase [Desulfobulbus propionicus]
MTDFSENIGILGGTFDPVHEGHLAMARLVLQRQLVDRILFIPAAKPVHKQAPAAGFEHRFAMLKLMVTDEQGMSVSRVERELAGPSYTIRTVRELMRRNEKARFTMIIGADSLLELHRWYRHEELLALVAWIVAARADITAAQVTQAIALLGGTPVVENSPHHTFLLPGGHTLAYLADFSCQAASSNLRMKPQQRDMLASAVHAYIRRHRLYGLSGEQQ